MPVELVRVERQKTAERINQILNHPDVRPFVADESEGKLDISAKVSNEKNVLLMGEFGACMLDYIMDGMYEVHTQFLPEGRGAWGRSFLNSAAHWLFTHTYAVDVMTRVPRNNGPAKSAAQNMGMKYDYTREDGCKWNGEVMPVDIYSFRIQDWIKDAPFVARVGHQFHDMLNEEAKRIGIKAQPHEDDENHNRYVGACVEMARAGLVKKCVAFYNRWAVLSRHATIQFVSDNPPLIRMDIGVLGFEGDGIRVTPCQ